MVIFALGETMLSPVGPALVNEIAPEHLRGRYTRGPPSGLGVSGTLAPAITALYSTITSADWWPLVLASRRWWAERSCCGLNTS